MIKIKELTINDLPNMVKSFGSYSSGDTMQSFCEQPLQILLYKEIIKYSNKELENIKTQDGLEQNFYNTVLNNRNYLAFAGLLEQKAFSSKLGPFSNWCLQNLDYSEHKFELYAAIYHNSQSNYGNTSIKGVTKKDYLSLSAQLKNLDNYFLSTLPEEKMINNTQKIYEHFKQFNIKEINEYCFNNLTDMDFKISDKKDVKLCQRVKLILDLMKKDNININENFLMDKYLPQQEKNNEFFISSAYFQSMTFKLEAGYRFNEEEYTYDGKTLLETILSTTNSRFVNLIGPYINRLEPLTMTLAEQNVLLERFSKIDNYDDVVSNYLALIEQQFSKNIPDKNHIAQKRKI